MKLPYVPARAGQNKRQIVEFGGVNYSRSFREGELEDSLGLSAEQFPCLAQRAGRRSAGHYDAPTALYARGELCLVDGSQVLYGGEVVGQVAPGAKTFAAINTRIVIFPDKVCYDTATGEFGSLGARLECAAGMVSFEGNSLSVSQEAWFDREAGTRELSGLSAAKQVDIYTGAAVDPSSGALTMSESTQKTAPNVAAGDLLREGCGTGEYLAAERVTLNWDGTWTIAGTLHRATAVTCPELESLFRAGDAVEISGCTAKADNNGSHIVREVEGRTLRFDKDIFSQTGAEAGAVTLERRVPDLTCLCECDNRLWGAEGHTIYASALGDPTNFFVYDGLSTDSYAVAVGTQGEFTGCAAYSSTVLFFKEDCIHRILGSYPAQYELYTYSVPGIQAGSEKSLAVIRETLFYKGLDGVYAYAGGAPELVSECFGNRRFGEAVAGTDGTRYYISMKEEDRGWGLYVYDTRRGIWLREDGTRAVGFAALDGTLYYLDGDTGQLTAAGQDEEEGGPIRWSATLCPFDETTHGRKGYSRLYLRVELAAGAWIRAEVSADAGPFRQVYVTHDHRAGTFTVPILPVRCDSFRVRLSGEGKCVIKSLVREFCVGSEY